MWAIWRVDHLACRPFGLSTIWHEYTIWHVDQVTCIGIGPFGVWTI